MADAHGISLMIRTVSYYYRLPFAEDLPEEKLVDLFATIEFFRKREAISNSNSQAQTLINAGLVKKKK